MGCLDPLDRAVLAFARSHPRSCVDGVTRPALGLSATAYYRRLLALLDGWNRPVNSASAGQQRPGHRRSTPTRALDDVPG